VDATPPHVADAELVRRALDGDKAALAELLDRHRHLAFSVCLRLLDRPDLAEDAVQEAAVVALVGLDKLRRPDRFGAWLAGVAANVARRWLRSAARRPAGSIPVIETVDPAPGPEQVLVDLETRRRVRAAVARLPAGQRDAATLYYLEERSGGDVAAALGITTAAAKTRLHKARAGLRRQFVTDEEVRSVSIDMRVADVRREPEVADGVRRHAIVLEEAGGDRQLPIYVGEPEATALALHLVDAELPRPMTHVLLGRVIEALGGRVAEVAVTRLTELTFYGQVVVEGPGGRVEVDARPSDAINLAVLSGAPIRVEPAVLDACLASGHAELPPELSEGRHEIADECLAHMAAALARLEEPDT
jgi:RNA polymerase sigma factor (sigma-70 family)